VSFETRKKATAPRQDIAGSPNIYKFEIGNLAFMLLHCLR